MKKIDAEVPGLPVPWDQLTTGRFIAGCAARHGARPALIGVGRTLSYEALYAQSRALARGLLGLGAEPGTRVALLLGNSPDFVTAWYACGVAGAVAVPLSTYSTAQEIDDALRRSRAAILITRSTLARRRFVEDLEQRHADIRGLRGGSGCSALPDLRHVIDVAASCPDGWALTRAEALARGESVAEGELDVRLAATRPDDEATILFTSGSTGTPKAIRHAHRTPVIMSWRWAEQLEIAPKQRLWTAYPFFWSAGLALGMGAPLAAGAALALQPVIEPGAALDMIAAESIDMLTLSAHVDVELAAEQRQRPRQLSALRRVRGGDRLLAELGLAGDLRDLGAGYGLSETFTLVSGVRGLSEEQRRRTHGYVFPGVELRIVDPATGTARRQGESGEIAIRGLTRMLGYLDVPDEEAFDPEGFYRPGDIGHIDADGLLHWEGRGREMIRSRGANVAPVEIELQLAQWGGIKFGRAVGIPHPAYGEAIVVCGVRPRASSVTEQDVVAALKPRLSSYKLPHRVLFFAESDLELTGTNKVRGASLRQLAARRIVAAGTDPEWADYLRKTPI